MVLFLNQTMQEKEVYLKRIGKFFLLLLIIKLFIFFPQNKLFSNKLDVLGYFNNIKEFSAFFIQLNEGDLAEGKLYYKNNRLRVDYIKPSNILIILAKKKAMYFNKDLDELEYFNPRKSVAKIFFNIFNQKNYLSDSKFLDGENFVKLVKEIDIEKNEKFELTLIFEKKPTLIRGIKITNENDTWEYSLLNHNFNPNLSDDFFSMVNPRID